MEARIVAVLRDQAPETDISEELLLATIPQLADLETQTYEGLVAQASKHLEYEVAAAQLVSDAVASNTRELQLQKQVALSTSQNEAKEQMQRLEDEAREQLEEERSQAEESAAALQAKIQSLERRWQAHGQPGGDVTNGVRTCRLMRDPRLLTRAWDAVAGSQAEG